MLTVLVAFAYGVQTTAGFGAGLILVSTGIHFVELPTLVALLLPLSIVQTGWITAHNHHNIDRTVLFRRVLPFMGFGVILGYALASRLAGMLVLKQVLGGFVVLLAGRELWLLYRGTRPAVGGAVASTIAIFCAGIMHGLYTTGGPPLVYGLGRENLPRASFRATITVVWLILNIGLVATFALDGRYTPDILQRLVVLATGLPIGIFVGERMFARVSERTFRILIYGMLAITGVPLLLG